MDKTKIQWTDATINFWTGCKKVSTECKYCYMFRGKASHGQDGHVVVKVSDKHIQGILRKLTTPSLIFACSWSDYFIEDADEWREAAWEVIRRNPQHQWQILTKRPERIKECLPQDWGTGWKNVWLGVSIGNEDYKDRLLTLHELKGKDSTFLTFVSYEPALSQLNLLNDPQTRDEFKRLDWMIVGGESGNATGRYRYRPCKVEWIDDMIQQCRSAGVKVFVKQLGTDLAKKLELHDRHGGDINEWDTAFQVREFPNYEKYVDVSIGD